MNDQKTQLKMEDLYRQLKHLVEIANIDHPWFAGASKFQKPNVKIQKQNQIKETPQKQRERSQNILSKLSKKEVEYYGSFEQFLVATTEDFKEFLRSKLKIIQIDITEANIDFEIGLDELLRRFGCKV